MSTQPAAPGLLARALETWREIRDMPRLAINLKLALTAGNDPFYRQITEEFFVSARRRHPRMPLLRQLEFGYCVCELGADPRPYSQRLDSAARRNLKKALRLGYVFRALDYNARLRDITAIHRSTRVRQGRDMPAEMIEGEAGPHRNPPSLRPEHTYLYFGVFKDDVVVAYAGCLVAGELCSIDAIFGHAEHLSDGVVPLAIASIGDLLLEQHPGVRYFAYGTYFGATTTMKRFKRKFLFTPRRVEWLLGD